MFRQKVITRQWFKKSIFSKWPVIKPRTTSVAHGHMTCGRITIGCCIWPWCSKSPLVLNWSQHGNGSGISPWICHSLLWLSICLHLVHRFEFERRQVRKKRFHHQLATAAPQTNSPRRSLATVFILCSHVLCLRFEKFSLPSENPSVDAQRAVKKCSYWKWVHHWLTKLMLSMLVVGDNHFWTPSCCIIALCKAEDLEKMGTAWSTPVSQKLRLELPTNSVHSIPRSVELCRSNLPKLRHVKVCVSSLSWARCGLES